MQVRLSYRTNIFECQFNPVNTFGDMKRAFKWYLLAFEWAFCILTLTETCVSAPHFKAFIKRKRDILLKLHLEIVLPDK